MTGTHHYEIGRLPADQAGRRRRLSRLVGGLILLTFVALLGWGRFYLAADREAATLERGARALAAALAGDAAAWAEVDAAYGVAARASVLDGYPLFVLELSRTLRRGEAAGDTAEVRATTAALLARDFESAWSLAASVGDERGRQWLQRLAAHLRAVEAAVGPLPSNPEARPAAR